MTDLIRVRDAMSPLTQMIQAGQTLVAARQRMQGEMRVKSLIVVDGDRPVGMVRYTDLVGDGAPIGSTVASAMLTTVPAIRPDQTLEEVSGIMTEYDVDRLAVVDERGALVGELQRAALTLSETVTSGSAGSAHATAADYVPHSTGGPNVRHGMEVVGSHGHKVGKVKEVRSDSLSGALTHVVVHTGLIFGKDKSIPADLIAEVNGETVTLKVDKAEVDMLPDLGDAE